MNILYFSLRFLIQQCLLPAFPRNTIFLTYDHWPAEMIFFNLPSPFNNNNEPITDMRLEKKQASLVVGEPC